MFSGFGVPMMFTGFGVGGAVTPTEPTNFIFASGNNFIFASGNNFIFAG